MQSLINSFNNIVHELEEVCATDITTISDAKNLKIISNNIELFIKQLETQVANLSSLKAQTLLKINAITKPIEEQLLVAEAKFGIIATEPVLIAQEKHHLNVNIGHNLTVKMPLYKSLNDAPIFTWSAVNIFGAPKVVFKFDNNNYVSCTSVEIIDFGSVDNYHTVCCSNIQRCEFDRACRYFHDPVLWKNSTHVQKFTKTNLVKRNPYFGHYADTETYTFDDLRTLARYCATQLLMIKIAMDKNKN